METQKTQNSQSILRKKNGAGGINLPDFRLYHKATVIMTVIKTVWHKNRDIDQWNQIESPEIHPCTYGFLIFYKGGKNIQWGKDSLFNKWGWENWTATCKWVKLEHFLTPYTKINSKYCKTRNYTTFRGKHRTLDDINQSKILYDPPPGLTEIKTKVNKWDPIKLKSFCIAKETIARWKDSPKNGRK